MVAGPNEQPNPDQFNLLSLRTRVDDQASALIKRGLNLANEIEADLSLPSHLDQRSHLEDPASDPPIFNPREEAPPPQSSSLEITTQIQSIVLDQATPETETTKATGETSWAMVWLRRGIHKYEQADYVGAKDNFKQALQKQSALAAAYNGLGSVLYQDKDFVEAVAVYHQALEYAPQNAQLYCNLGSALYQIQNFDEAALTYQKAIYFNPYLQVAYYGLGLAHSQLGFQEEAVTAFEQATQLNVRDADSFWGLGAALHALGEYQEANIALRQAMQLNPLYIEVYLRFQNIL